MRWMREAPASVSVLFSATGTPRTPLNMREEVEEEHDQRGEGDVLQRADAHPKDEQRHQRDLRQGEQRLDRADDQPRDVREAPATRPDRDAGHAADEHAGGDRAASPDAYGEAACRRRARQAVWAKIAEGRLQSSLRASSSARTPSHSTSASTSAAWVATTPRVQIDWRSRTASDAPLLVRLRGEVIPDVGVELFVAALSAKHVAVRRMRHVDHLGDPSWARGQQRRSGRTARSPRRCRG